MRIISQLLCVLLFTSAGYSQSGLLRKESDKNGSIIFAEFMTDSVPRSIGESKQLLRQLHALAQDEEYLLTESKTDELGFTHQYFNQYYKGIRVAYSSYSVHGKDNIIHTVNGTYNQIRNVNTAAKLSESVALAVATKFVNASVYKWEVPAEEQWLKENYNNESYYPKGELVIITDRLKSNKQFRLAWKFDVYAHIPLSRNLIYVDAISGDILDTESKIHHINSPGTGATRYSGARGIISDSFTGGFRLRETRSNVRIETYNMRNQGTNYGGATDFVDNDNNWTVAEFNNTNMDNAALDAHWGAEMVYDYFNTVHSRNSWNGVGGALLSYVHTDLHAFDCDPAPGHQPCSNDNAFWDGQRMTYADGEFCFDPLTSLDVVAHEIAHGVNSSTARMKYQGESGALNESLSDIWAACIELWAAPEKQIWLLGEDISECAVALRSMNNPSSLSYSLADGTTATYPDTFNGTGYYTGTQDAGGVHINSSVSNFWFFLMVNGGTGTNDNGNCYNVTGVGINNAARIVYRAETVILASSSEQTVTFNQFRNATITAASNLFGANSAEVIAVTNAWFAVGVGGEYVFTSNNITGPSLVCTSSAQFSLNNAPAGATVTWVATPASLFAVSSGSGMSASLSAASSSSSGSGTLTFTISGCSNSVQVQKSFWVGKPTYSGVSIVRDINDPNQNISYVYTYSNAAQFYVNIASGVTSYQWTITSDQSCGSTYDGPKFYSNGNGTQATTTSNKINVNTGTCSGTFWLQCKAVNSCGQTYYSQRLFKVTDSSGGGGCEYSLSTYPNPSDIGGDVTINLVPPPPGCESSIMALDSQKVSPSDQILSVTLIDNSGNAIRDEDSSGTSHVLNTNKLNRGVYFIKVQTKQGRTFQTRIIKN